MNSATDMKILKGLLATLFLIAAAQFFVADTMEGNAPSVSTLEERRSDPLPDHSCARLGPTAPKRIG